MALCKTISDNEDLELGRTSSDEEEVHGWGQGWEVALPNPSQSATLRHPVPLILPQAQMYKPAHIPGQTGRQALFSGTDEAAGYGSVAGIGSGTGSVAGICWVSWSAVG